MSGGSNFDVVVRLSTVGNEQLSSNLANVRGVAQSMADTLNNADAGTKRLSASFRQTDADGNKFAVTIRDLGQAHGKYVSVADQLTGSLLRMATAFEAFRIVKDLTGDLYGAVKAHEDETVTLAATMAATNGWANSMILATGVLEKLKETGALVGGTTAQMVDTFTLLKRTFGGTSDDAALLTEKLALLARQYGTTADLLATRLAGASITGRMVTRGAAGIALTSTGIDPQELMTMKAAGQAMDYLNAKIAEDPELVAQLKNNWSYLTAEFAKNKETALEMVGQGLEPLKGSLHELNDTLSSSESQASFDKLGQNLAVLTGQLGSLFAPGGMQESEHWYTEFLDKAIAFFSTLILIWKVGIDSVGNAAAGLWDVITNPMKYFGAGGGDAMKAELTRVLDEQLSIFKTAAEKAKTIWATAGGAQNEDLASGKYIGLGDPVEKPTAAAPGRPVDLSKLAEEQIKAANAVQDAWDKAYIATLTGLDKQLAEVDFATQHEIDAFAKTGSSWNQMVDFTVARTAEGEAKKQALILAGTEKQLEEAQKYYTALAGLGKKSSDDAIQQIEEQLSASIAQADKQYEAGKVAAAKAFTDKETLNAALVALDQAHAVKIGNLLVDAAQKEVLLIDERRGDWESYYQDLMNMADAAGDHTYATAHSILEKTATLAYANADTMAKGYEAGFLKIRASVRSFGQDVADTMTTLWADLGTAFDTGFYDVLSGKLSSIGDVLKSLWDSILKDFSKMLSQMLERWLITGDAMGNGQGKGGILGGLLGAGAGLAGAGVANGATSTQYGDWSSGAPPAGGGGIGAGASAVAYAAAAVGVYMGIAEAMKTTKANISYQNVDLGQQNFGGDSFGQKVTPWISAAVAAGIANIWVGVAIAVVGIVVSLFNGPQEGHVNVAIADAFSSSGATQAVSQFVTQVFDATTNYVGKLALKAAGPEGVAGYVAAYQKAFADAYQNAKFDIHAGSAADLQKDVQQFFEQVLPKMALQAGFGQVGFGPAANSSAVGGVAGLDWNPMDFRQMDMQGNVIKQQLYDPNAPIPQMLAGLGFTADAITALAQKLAGSSDIKVFETYLTDLVGIVVDFGDLAMQFGRTTQQWFDFIHAATAQQGTAASFEAAISHLTAGGELLATIFGDDRVAAAKALVTEGQTLLSNMAQALASILDFIDQIATSTAATIQNYQDKLLSPADIEAANRARAAVDTASIATAANPKDVAAAWNAVVKDLSAVLDAIVARIQAIQALQQSYADFRTTMATNAGPDFATDPTAWLLENQGKINAITTTLATATGDDAIAGARTLLQLVQDRYNNELAMLQRVKAAIVAVDAQVASSIQQLQLQAMGSVTTDAQGNRTWTPDTHAQGDAMWTQLAGLEQQLGQAATPEAANRIWGLITGLLGQLAAQPQDPAHYAESRRLLEQAWTDAGKIFDAQMLKIQHTLKIDLAGIGTQLKAGETALKNALGLAQNDFTTQLGLLTAASASATTDLNGFGDALVTQMGDLVKAIKGWIWLFTHPGEAPPGTHVPGPGGNIPRLPVAPDPTGAPGGHPPLIPTAMAPTVNINVTAQVAVSSGLPEDVAGAVVDAVGQILYPKVVATIKQSNTQLLRLIVNNRRTFGLGATS
jgi:uncharacterized coiled-coil protein SlyX